MPQVFALYQSSNEWLILQMGCDVLVRLQLLPESNSMDVNGDITILSSLALKYHNSGVKHPEDNWADLLKVTYHTPDICRLQIDYLCCLSD